MVREHFDVVIVGGGPAGSTTGSLLKKYRPGLRVLILEREQFPRDHVGESLLPGIPFILDEMGCWDKVEAANFPIKVGATFKWGRTAELWDLDFMPIGKIRSLPRPGKFEGQRRHLAFQVDRSIYDKILLDHAETLGCDVRQQTRAIAVDVAGDRIERIRLDGGVEVSGRWYIDATGHSGLLRRALGIKTESPTALQNIAMWDYWQNAKWAEEIGIGGTRIQVMSLSYGWLWFIPLGPERTSLGLVMPKRTFKELKQSAEEIYAKAVFEDPHIAKLLAGATCENHLQTTRDWSFVSERHCGENWFLVGESSGFADPILSAGLTITHSAGKEAAYTIGAIIDGEDSAWLLSEYSRYQTRRIRNHIRFADYWYTANAQFNDLKEFTAELARENGLDLTPESAWEWIAQGGFIVDDLGATVGGFHLSVLNELGNHMGTIARNAALSKNNVFKMNLSGAAISDRASYVHGKVHRLRSYVRDEKIWPISRFFGLWFEILSQTSSAPEIARLVFAKALSGVPPEQRGAELFRVSSVLEALIADGWVSATYDPTLPLLRSVDYVPTVYWKDKRNDASGVLAAG